MNLFRSVVWQRGLAACVALALMLAGCAHPQREQQRQQQPRQSASITLIGIVVDGSRLAGEGETGLIRVWRDGRPMEGQIGLTLLRGDFIESGPRADAVIRFPNGSTLYMRPDSRGRVGSLSEAVGEFFARIKGVFSIESSFVRAAANGTAFLVRAQTDGETTVTVLEGSVHVDSTRGAWQRILVGAGQSVVAQVRASPVMAADERDMRRTRDWADQLDRLLPNASGSASSSGSSVGTAIAVGVAIAAAAALLSSRDKDKRPADSASSPSYPTSLAAPVARGIGNVDAARATAIDCNRPVSLSWGAVAGASDFLVTLQARGSARAPWTTVQTEPTTQQRIEVAAQTGGAYRWSVQARTGSRSGPASDTLYFACGAIRR